MMANHIAFCPICDILISKYNEVASGLGQEFDYDLYLEASAALTRLIDHRAIVHKGAK